MICMKPHFWTGQSPGIFLTLTPPLPPLPPDNSNPLITAINYFDRVPSKLNRHLLPEEIEHVKKALDIIVLLSKVQ